jgi:peroxiredoxin
MPINQPQTANGDATFETNSLLDSARIERFKDRDNQLWQILNSGSPNAIDQFVEGAWPLVADYPEEINVYQNIMAAIASHERAGAFAKARALAEKMITSAVPEEFKLWSKGFLNRLDLLGKTVALQFTAVDGRKVDSIHMRGKVVLVFFSSTRCKACKTDTVKEMWKKYHAQGLEVIGISTNASESDLEEFAKCQEIPWPQYFGGQRRTENKFTVEFGVNGIPHLFLLDKKGVLRFDNLRGNFDEKISALLAEPNDC